MRAALAAATLAVSVAVIPAFAASGIAPEPRRDGEPLAGADTPLGAIDYVPGRGLRIGDTGFTLGGFATLEAEHLEEDDGSTVGGIEGASFFLFFDPSSLVHLFSELEVADLARATSEREGIRSDPGVEVDRLFADLTPTDMANLRFGKFLTPIGRWNQAPAEPLIWTTSEPLIVEEVFDETVSGAMVFGSAFPRGGSLSYSLYGTFLDHIAPDREAPPAGHAAGARLEWTSLDGWSVGASYFVAEEPDAAQPDDDDPEPGEPVDPTGSDDGAIDESDVALRPFERALTNASPGRSRGGWNHLGGIDGLWRPHPRLEFSLEALAGEGTRRNGGLWGVFVQAVVELVPTLHGVGRYEHFAPPGRAPEIDLFDLGLAWVPLPNLRLKADYRLVHGRDDGLAEPGFRSSLSVLF